MKIGNQSFDEFDVTQRLVTTVKCQVSTNWVMQPLQPLQQKCKEVNLLFLQ